MICRPAKYFVGAFKTCCAPYVALGGSSERFFTTEPPVPAFMRLEEFALIFL